MYIYVWRYVCHNSSACHAYVMWAELGHCHFLYVLAVYIVTNGNDTGTKNDRCMVENLIGNNSWPQLPRIIID